jgi:hypothetical protein
MAWMNQSILEHNLIELSNNCTSKYNSKPLLGFLLISKYYIILFYILGINGIIQNLLVIQTLISASFREKWNITYKLIYSVTGLILSICLMINVFWNEKYFLIMSFICVILNVSSIWISTVLSFERMLMQIFFFTLYGMSSGHAIIISFFVYLLVSMSFVLSMIYSQISLLLFYFHLITPGIIHIISLIVTFISVMQRKCYLSEYPINFSSFVQILLNQGGFFITPLCNIICLIISIVSIHQCFLIVFNISFFILQMISFVLYIMPSKINMKKFRMESPCGRLMMKLHL